MKTKKVPRILIDLNARMTDRGYLLHSGSLSDLEKLGLTPETAVGVRFEFVDKSDGPEECDWLVSEGTVTIDEQFGYLACLDREPQKRQLPKESKDA